MKVLLVARVSELRNIWARALGRLGAEVVFVLSQSDAICELINRHFDVIVTDLVLDDGSAFAIWDFENYRRPDVQIFFVTNTTFFLMD